MKATVYYNEYTVNVKAQRIITVDKNSVNHIIYEFLRQTGKSEYTYIRYVKCNNTRYDVCGIAKHYAMAP